jgi:uncharacterized protein (TIGR02147 family)
MVTVPQQSLSVFQFLDAREFLRRAYDAQKRVNKGFSHRYIAKAMGAGSSSFFKDVLNGRASLNPARAARFARLFCMPDRDAEYFERLVLYTQATMPDEKERLLKMLTRGKGAGEQSVLEASQTEYIQKWHYAAVRELLVITDAHGDPAALGEKLDPPLTAAEVRSALELLLRLKLIRKTAQGRYEKVDKVVVTGPKTDPSLARAGILANLDLARRALDLHPRETRPFSYLTVSVSKDSLHYIQEKLREVRRDILERVSRDEAVDRLYQINMQVFPLSKPPAKQSHSTPAGSSAGSKRSDKKAAHKTATKRSAT